MYTAPMIYCIDIDIYLFIYLFILTMVIFRCAEDTEMDSWERTEVYSVLRNVSYAKFLA